MTDLQQILTKPCLLEKMEGVVIAHPLRFFSARQIYEIGRHAKIRAVRRLDNQNAPVHPSSLVGKVN